ncbi:MAG: ABC transporter C-terminal domain-containing protein, partial [Pseudomonadota bacterium]
READKLESKAQKNNSGKIDNPNMAEILERKISELLAQKDELENEMAVCSTNNDANQLKRLTKSFEKLQKEIEIAENEWAEYL